MSTYRDDITEALVQSVIRRSGHASFNEAGLWQAAYQDADAVLAVRDTELERLHTWDGLLALLDEHWPEDIVPTLPDSEDRDPGPRIVSLLRWVERLREERDHAAAAAEGSHEGIRLWMLDCAALTQKHRDRADRAEAQLAEAKALAGVRGDLHDEMRRKLVAAQNAGNEIWDELDSAKKKINDLSSSLTHVRVERSDVESVARTLLSYRLAVKQTGIRRGAPDNREAADAALRLIAALTNPPPGDTPEPNRSGS